MERLTDFPIGTQIVRWYDIHGILCQIIANEAEILALLEESVGYFACAEPRAAAYLTLRIAVLPVQTVLPRDFGHSWQCVWQTADMACYVSGNWVRFEYANEGVCVINVTQGISHAYLYAPGSAAELRQCCREMVLPCLFGLLQGKGLVRIHAAAVNSAGKGLVIAGASGQGKTTLLLHLLHTGEAAYLADDAVLLRARRSSLEILAFPSFIGVSAQTARLFPELRDALTNVLPDARGKYRVNVAQMYPRASVRAATPALLVFPEIRPQEHTSLVPLAKMEAAFRLLPENLVVSDRPASQQNFQLLAQLIQAVPCYAVRLGRDVNGIGQQLMEIL